MLTEKHTTLIGRFPLGLVATIRADDGPAVSPRGTFLVLNDVRVGYADIRSPESSANRARNNRMEVSVLDPFARKSVRLAGVHPHPI